MGHVNQKRREPKILKWYRLRKERQEIKEKINRENEIILRTHTVNQNKGAIAQNMHGGSPSHYKTSFSAKIRA